MLLLKPILPVFSYALHYEYIVKELCENRKKPELKCNGKCHLMKELAKSAAAEKPVSGKKAPEIHEVLFINPLSVFELQVFFSPSVVKETPPYSNLYAGQYMAVDFHPPAISL